MSFTQFGFGVEWVKVVMNIAVSIFTLRLIYGLVKGHL